MTRQEAIAVLESDAEYMYSQDSPYNREAYQMAIEALKAEPVKHGRWKPFDLTWGRSVYACTNCGEAETLNQACDRHIKIINSLPTIETEPQRAYEQGVKDTLDKYDEDFRIASEIRIAVGCNTAKECWELAQNGDIQVVKHGQWIEDEYGIPHCSKCGTINNTVYRNYCPNCGAKMDLDEVKE